jgi:hypothetical protein
MEEIKSKMQGNKNIRTERKKQMKQGSKNAMI